LWKRHWVSIALRLLSREPRARSARTVFTAVSEQRENLEQAEGVSSNVCCPQGLWKAKQIKTALRMFSFSPGGLDRLPEIQSTLFKDTLFIFLLPQHKEGANAG